jgi:hypothetical protein
MEIHKPEVIKNFRDMERSENVILDNSSIAAWKKCPRLYFFQYILHMRPKVEPLYFPFGTAYHKFRELIELRWNEKGKSKAPSVMDECYAEASSEAFKSFAKATQDRDFQADRKWGFLNPARLVESFAVGFQHWQKEKNVGNIEVIMVEQVANINLNPNDDEDPIFFSFRADQLIKVNGTRVWGRDFKTTKDDLDYYDRSLTPNSQFSGYTFAESLLTGEAVAGQYVEVLYNKSVPPATKVPPHERYKKFGPIIQTFPASRTRMELNEWRENQLFFLDQIKVAREKDHYPMNEQYHCRMCQFHSCCSLGTNGARQAHLEAFFIRRVWDNANPSDEGGSE